MTARKKILRFSLSALLLISVCFFNNTSLIAYAARDTGNKKPFENAAQIPARALYSDAAAAETEQISNTDVNVSSDGLEIKSNQRILTVLMYHQVLSRSRGSYVITPSIFENDIEELLARGYKTVFPSEVIAFAEHGAELPQKPLMITIDDGHYNSVYYCRPILKKYNCKALINVVGSYCDYSTTSGDHSKVAYSYLTWDQIKEINDKKTFEVGNHTYAMHKFSPRRGISKMKDESDNQYKSALTQDVMKLQNKLQNDCGITATCFAYPFGLFNKAAKNIIIDMGFKMILNCSEKRNIVTAGEKGCLYSLCRFNRAPNLSSAAFFDKIEKSKA